MQDALLRLQKLPCPQSPLLRPSVFENGYRRISTSRIDPQLNALHRHAPTLLKIHMKGLVYSGVWVYGVAETTDSSHYESVITVKLETTVKL